MTLRAFAEKYRVKATLGKQGCEDLVLGKYGEIADDYGNGLLRLRLLAVPRNASMNGALNGRKKEAGTAGMVPLHVAPNTYESIWGFSPDNAELCKLAIRLVHPKRKRTVIMSEGQKDALRLRFAAARTLKTQNAVSISR